MKHASSALRASSFIAVCAVVVGCGFIEPDAPPPDTLHLSRAQFATSMPADIWAPPPERLQLPAALHWTPVSLPHALSRVVFPASGERDPGQRESIRLWFRMEVPASQVSADFSTLYLPRWHTLGYVSIYVDGALIYSSMAEGIAGSFNEPLLVHPLHGLGPTGQPLRLVVRVDCWRATGAALSSIWLGPVTHLRSMFRTRRLLQNIVPQVTSSIFLVLGLFAFLVWVRRRHETTQLLFSILAVLFYLRNLHYYVAEPPLPTPWFSWLTVNSLGWLNVVVYFFASQLYGGASRVFARLLLVTMVLTSVLTLPLPVLHTSLAVLSPVIYLLFTLVGLAVTLMVSVSALRSRSIECGVLAGILWLNLGLGVHDWMLQNWRTDIESIYLLPLGVLALFAMFLTSVSRRYLRALSDAENASALLEVRLADRERELKASYEKLSAVEQAQLLSHERQRLMREMHDGLGSALMSSLIAVERGQMDSADIVQVLRECVDDLKLTIDSLEPVGDDLLVLLATLRFRLEGRLEAAGIELRWEVGTVPSVTWLNPTLSLHILRIVQEMLTNVLKHAHAKMIRVSVAQVADVIAIAVQDDGVGFDVAHATPSGRGLANLRQRAALLEAKLEIESRPGATRVCLRLPVQLRDAGCR